MLSCVQPQGSIKGTAMGSLSETIKKEVPITSLQEILTYKHLGVIQRYKRDSPTHALRAETLFEDLMAFFWTSKKHEVERIQNPNDPNLDFTFIMDEEMIEIDKMWHVFLLYTQDYMDFCDKYFGQYLHHLPDVVPNGQVDTTNAEQNLERFLNYVQKNLGDAFIQRWFYVSSAA